MTHNVLNTTTPELYGQQTSPYGATGTSWKTNMPGVDEAAEQQAGGTTPQTQQVNSTTPQTQEASSEEPVVTVNPKAPLTFDGQVTAQAASLWDNGFEAGLKDARLKDASIAEAIQGYNAYAKEQGKDPLDILQIYTVLQGNDPLKSVEQNEEDLAKAQHRERWEQTSNVLSHLGNFIGALAGAPDQNIESSIELSKRQQLLRDKTLEQRRQMSNDYLRIYQAQQASEVAKAKEARAQQQQDRLDAELFLKQKQLEWKIKESDGKMDLAQQKLELEKTKTEIMRQVQMGRLSQGAARIALAQLNYDLRAAGSTTTTTTSDGKTRTVVRTPGRQAAPAGGQSKKIGW